jgi:hypothetical protein
VGECRKLVRQSEDFDYSFDQLIVVSRSVELPKSADYRPEKIIVFGKILDTRHYVPSLDSFG